jgi:ketosteroid isomerase-like protein
MTRTLLILAIVAMLLPGCASHPRARIAAEYPDEQTGVQSRLKEIFDAAEKKDFPRLESYHFYGPKFTKFSPEAAGRLDADAARKGERDGLGAINGLSMRAEDLKVDVFGDAAIATFLFHYSFKTASDTIQKQALATLVFVNDRGDWKIAHEHFSTPKASP